MSMMGRSTITGLVFFIAAHSLGEAAPLAPSAINAAPPQAEILQVRNRGGAVAAGIIGGMILGGVIAAQRPRAYYGPYYPYYQAGPAYPYDPAVSYCLRRYKSYDPYSMTYLGYDGYRHPCP